MRVNAATRDSLRRDQGGVCTQAECERALKGLALPRASHSGEIALSGLRRLRDTLATVPVLYAQAVVTVAKNSASATPR